MSLDGKTAVVTGGSSGIGLATSRPLLLHGIEILAIFDVNYSHDVIDKLKCEFPKSVVVFRKTDVANRSEVESSFKEISRKYGYIEVLVNCAGYFDEVDVQKTFAINVIGTINCTQTAVELMSVEKGGQGGIIANVASVVGLDPYLGHPIYNATKHAVVGFTRSLGDPFYYNIYGVKFVIICPGITDTPFIANLSDRYYRADAKEPGRKVVGHMPRQTPEECGKALVDVLTKADNGSIWIIDAGEARRVILPNQWLPN